MKALALVWSLRIPSRESKNGRLSQISQTREAKTDSSHPMSLHRGMRRYSSRVSQANLRTEYGKLNNDASFTVQ